MAMKLGVCFQVNAAKVVPVTCALIAIAVLFASNNVVSVISTNQVDNSGGTAQRFEATSAVGSATWATGWSEYAISPAKASYVSAWGGPWSAQHLLQTPGGTNLGDVNLSWDPVHGSPQGRFVFVALEVGNPTPPTQPNVWYGYSSDAHGSSWSVQTIAFSGTFSTGGWDYPSVGVDPLGNIIVGAVSMLKIGTGSCPSTAKNPCPNGYYSNISTDGQNFNSTPSLVTSGAGAGAGAQSRVVATSNNTYHAFVPTLDSNNLPNKIIRWQSSNGTTWTQQGTVLSFVAPLNNSPTNTPPVIFYGPLLTAQGYTDGRWTIAFQVNNGGFSNVEDCTSDRGCGMVNPCPGSMCSGTDQFLAGTGTYNDKGYWISYYTYTTLPRTLPLVTQAIYCPPGVACIGATTNTGIDPTNWVQLQRCPMNTGQNGACYAAGDYQGIAAGRTSAPSSLPGASTPFVKQASGVETHLWQSFTQDPQAVANVPNFIPDSIWVPLGSDISSIAGPPPPGTDLAYPPGHNQGMSDPVH